MENGRTKEYVESDKKIDLTEGKDEEAIKNRYETLIHEYEKEIEEKQAEEDLSH